MVQSITKLLILLMLAVSFPHAAAFAEDEAAAEGDAGPAEDPELNDRTAILPKLTFTVLLPNGKRHVIVSAWLQMQSAAWAVRATDLQSRISDAIINDLYPYFYEKGVAGEGLELSKQPSKPAEPVYVPTYGGGKGKYDDKIAAYLAKQNAGGSAEELAHEELKGIIQRAANRAIGKDRVLEVTLKQVIQTDR